MTSKSKAEPAEADMTSGEPEIDAMHDRSGMVRKVEFIDRIVEQTGLKKKDVKPAIEAALDLFAEALSNGKDLNLPPMGKLKVVKTKELDNGAKALTLKLRLSKPSEDLEDPSLIAAE